MSEPAERVQRRNPAGKSVVGVNLLFLVPGQVGGSETYVRNTLRAMAETAPDAELVLFTNRENHDSFVAELSRFPQVRFVPTGLRAVSKLRRAWSEHLVLPRLARRLRPDVLWNPGNVAPRFFRPCRVVTTIHDMQYRRFPEDYSRVGLRIMRLVTEMSLRRSDRILTISEFAKSEILRFSDVPADRIFVVPHGVSPAFDAPPAPAGEAPFLLSVSNTYPHKRMEDAVAAFGAVAGEFPALRLRLVGRPRLGEEAVRAAVAALPEGARRRVDRIEWIESRDLAGFYARAAVFLFPSNYEGFGLPVLEALRAGCPVVAARAASVPEVAGSCARYFGPRDVAAAAELVRGILRNPPSGADRAAWRARAASFTWERTAAGTLDALLSPDQPRA